MSIPLSPPDKYFAALPKEEVGPYLMKKIEDWFSHIQSSGIFRRMKKSYNTYFGLGSNNSSSEVTKSGVQGELSLIKVNHFRNLIQHVLVMTCASRPAVDARAINTDYRSIAQTVLANGILDFYMREKKLERFIRSAVELALVLGEGYVTLEWDANAGDPYMTEPDTNQLVMTGDIRYRVNDPLSIVRDVYLDSSADEDDWKMVRHFKNKFDLIAKYPEFSEKIQHLQAKGENSLEFNLMAYDNKTAGRSDLIPVYEFFHRKTEALPEGRQVVLLSSDVILFDGPLPYKNIPVYRISPSDYISTPYGYTMAFDLLGIQELVDAMHSVVITNQTTFGVQNVMVPKGHSISVDHLAGGLNLIEYDSSLGKPEPLNLVQTPAEIFNYIEKLEKTMETLSGVNAVARGNPDPNLRSGNSLALVQSMAIQFNSGLQQAYTQLIEDVGTATIETLRDFAEAPRVAMIIGKHNRAFLKEFKGSDLDKISRVVVDVGNPLAKTLAGKTEMATNMMQMGLIKTPDQYIQVVKTGNIDTMLEGANSELLLIKSENEALANGSNVPVVAIEAHTLHITEHKSVLSSPEAKENPEVTQAVLGHINEHINALKNTDPNLLQILGQPSLAQPQGGPEGMPSPGEPPAGKMATEQGQAGMSATNTPPPPGAAMGIGGEAPQVQPVTNPAQPIADQMPGMPSYPKNPLSGEKWTPETGGMPPK